ncbi:MAG: ion channel, partial [Pseudomonadota bacterium]
VETTDGTIRAKAVIVTVSTGVLGSGAIRFTPDLPVAKQDAIAALMHSTVFGDTLLLMLYSAIFFAVVHLARNVMGYATLGAATVGVWIVVTLFAQNAPGALPSGLALITTIILVAWMTACTLNLLLMEAKADGDALAGAVFGYFLLALLWSLLFFALEIASPGSVAISDGPIHLHTELLYYSLVTFTTLGYGDILPVSPFAKIMAGLSGAMGTLYLAILIGRIVGAFRPPDRRRVERRTSAESAPREGPER